MHVRQSLVCGVALAMALITAARARDFEMGGDSQYPNSIITPEPSAHRPPVKHKAHARERFHRKNYGRNNYGMTTPHALVTPPAPRFHSLAPVTRPPGQSSGLTVVPGVGSYPNLPPAPGVGQESFQDRAARCAHQAGLYGVPNTGLNQYMSACSM